MVLPQQGQGTIITTHVYLYPALRYQSHHTLSVRTLTLLPQSLSQGAMDTPGLTIYNVPPMSPKWDRIGVFYIAFAATWTAIVVAGMAFCWYNRHLPILRVRNLPLAFSGIIFLQLYWIMAQITYPIGATMPIVIAYDVQYFVMGTWFPLGIALFHASNLRFLQVARLQRQFANPDLKRRRGYNGVQSSSIFYRIRNMTYDTKVMVSIIVGLVIQVIPVSRHLLLS
jgi:hypothetical protein